MNIFDRLLATVRLVAVAVCVIATTMAALTAPVKAQGVGTTPSARQVIVGGILFLTVRDSWGGFTPEQRAVQVQERINHALSIGPVHASDISVAKVDGDWIVVLQGKRLFTADYDTAKLDQTPPQALATQWANFLRSTLPGLTSPTNGGAAVVTTAPAATQ